MKVICYLCDQDSFLCYIFYDMFDIKGKMSPLLLNLISWLSKRVFEPRGKKSFVKCAWTEFIMDLSLGSVFEAFHNFASDLGDHWYLQAEPLHLFICRTYAMFFLHSHEWQALHFEICILQFPKKTIAGSHQLISHLATAQLSHHYLHIPYIPLSSSSVLLLILFLTFGESFHLLPVFAQIQFKTLLPSYTAAGHHMKGFAAPQFLLCSARPVRKANSPTTVKERPEFNLIIKPYSCTWTINILFLLLRQAS